MNVSLIEAAVSEPVEKLGSRIAETAARWLIDHRGLQSLLRRAVDSDPNGSETALNRLTTCIDAGKSPDRGQSKLKRFQDAIAGIHREIEALLKDGDPADAIAALQQDLDELRESARDCHSQAEYLSHQPGSLRDARCASGF